MLSSTQILLLVVVASALSTGCCSEVSSNEPEDMKETKSRRADNIGEVLNYEEEVTDKESKTKEPTVCSCNCIINDKSSIKTPEIASQESTLETKSQPDLEPVIAELMEEEEGADEEVEETGKVDEAEEKVAKESKKEEIAKPAKKQKSNKNKSNKSSSGKSVAEKKRSKRSIKRGKPIVSKSTGKNRGKGSKK